MKPICTLILVCLLLPVFSKAQPGSSCSTPYPIPLDGITRLYATSSSTGNAVVCTISGSSPITYFSVTTNSAAEMPLLRIIVPVSTNCEVAMYNGACSGGNLETNSSLCFYDAKGLWTLAHDFPRLPNTTYNLRIKTVTSGNITITGESYSPPNNDCSGAMQIGPTPIIDNNACAVPGQGIIPSQICAFTLENTLFYKYAIAATGTSTIYITNI